MAPISTTAEKLEPPFDLSVELHHASSDFVVTEDSGPPQSIHISPANSADVSQTIAVPNTATAPSETQSRLSVQNGSPTSPRAHLPDVAKAPSDLTLMLPTIYRDAHHKIHTVSDDVDQYLRKDLDVSRLNAIHSILWMAGRPLNARPLHRYVMLDMRLLRTEQADMHILRVGDRVFLKPLPHYLLSYRFWHEYLCADPELHKLACGLLVSYVWLIITDLDLKIARENHLLPLNADWRWWKSFVSCLLSKIDANSLDQVNKRYHYGELRLARVNTIYRIRFAHTHFIRGYLYGYNRYVVFFQRNFGWMVVIFAYFSLVLSAMQVGVSVDRLEKHKAFMDASYGFVVFSIVLVAAIVGFVVVLFVGIFTTNTILSIRHTYRKRKYRKALARERKNSLQP